MDLKNKLFFLWLNPQIKLEKLPEAIIIGSTTIVLKEQGKKKKKVYLISGYLNR